MSNFPYQLDTDNELPRVDDNITSIGEEAINSLRSAMFAVESNIGTNAQGSTGSIAQFLSVSHAPDGSIKPSALVGIGLVTLPITDIEISPTAGIQESKLNLTYSTSSLYTLILILQNSIDVFNGFLSLTGIKLEPHIDGTNYNHLLSAIRVDPTPQYVKTNPTISQSTGTNIINRNTSNLNTLLQDINNDLVVHEKSDGSSSVTATVGGTVPPIDFAHVGAGIYVNPSNFSTIPQSNNNIQSIVEYFDNSSLLLLGSRTQNLYSNGISRTARSSSFLNDGYGEPLVPPTPAIAYFLNQPPGPIASSPVDDFNHGDDVILFNPTAQQLASFNFDAQFAQVRPGDLLTINYGTGISLQFVIDSTKAIVVGLNRTYAVRINGKNPETSPNAIARIDRSTFHRNKYGILASARAPNNTNDYESVIVANPRSAVALGNGFNPSMFDGTHYNIYLSLLSTGDISSLLILPPIDITGNKGTTPGNYTLDTIILNTNNAFRTPGFNYRFISFQYAGQFGIMLADPYNNASFSIISGVVDGYGNYTASSLSAFPNNVVDNFNNIDPAGFGATTANIASPPPAISYPNINAAIFDPTLFFYPLKRNFFYTNGIERDRVKSDPTVLNNIIDNFGDGYWPATILPPPATMVLPNRVEVVYQVNLDLSQSGLKNGKTVVIQPAFPITDPRYNYRDYGRFIIKNISFNNCNTPSAFANITVYDGVHGFGSSPAATSTNIPVNLYFSDDSVSFDAENVFDGVSTGPFKRFFEIYIDGGGHTFTHERARFINTSSDISNINIYEVSPKLRGYSVSNNKEILFTITTYDQTTGNYSGFLSSIVGPHTGPITSGKRGEIVRFYDESNIDYIDFIFDININIASFINKILTIQLFNTLELDEEVMLISSCQIDDISKTISYLKDERPFGNISEEQLSSSAIDFISAPQRLLNKNGIINGFNIEATSSTQISLAGGAALVNGKIVFINNSVITIPALIEVLYPSFSVSVSTISWFICVNNHNELELIASTDYDPSLSGTYGSLDQNRIFYVSNHSVGIPYPIRGTYFNNLLSNYKDVVPIYVVTATTSGATVSISLVSDLRSFLSNGYSSINNSFILSQEGQFRDIRVIDAWLTQLIKKISHSNTSNNTRGTNIDIRGDIILTSNITLDYPVNVSFLGNDGILDLGSNVIVLNNNISFSNLTINAQSATLTIGNNVSFTNCIINLSSSITVGNNISFIGCTINISGAIGFNFSNSNTFRNCTINYTYDATSDGSFSSLVLSNPTKACLFSTVPTSGLKNIIIDNCIFTSSNQNRFPFISMIFSSSPCFAENVTITNNKFNTSFNADDQLAVITFVGPSVSPTLTNGPRLNNCVINNNYCNKNQLILLSSPLIGSATLDMISATNVSISNNVCGAINILLKQDLPFISFNTSFIRDKNSNIKISNNICKLIYNGSSDGMWNFAPSTIQGGFGLFTAPTIIDKNTCSFMFVVCRSPSNINITSSPLIISENNFIASNSTFLTPYGLFFSTTSALNAVKLTGT
jgi:hypothetical protein